MSAFEVRLIAEGLLFPEGPVALPGGDVLVCELASGNLVRISMDGSKRVVAHTSGGPNGLAMGYDGRIWVANNGGNQWSWKDDKPHPTGFAPEDYVGGSIQAVDISTGEVEEVATHADGHRLAGLNDLVFDSEGNLYFTDYGKKLGRQRIIGGLYYLPRGARDATAIAYPLESPNGVALSPDGRRLYVSETPTAQLWGWDIDSPGILRHGHSANHPGNGTLICSIPGYCHLDSIAVDSRGYISVATLLRGVITVVRPSGQIETTVHPPEHDTHVTNLCFGGEGWRTAYVTAAQHGRLYAFDWPWPGFPLNFADPQLP
jgi:gluconolactonase